MTHYSLNFGMRARGACHAGFFLLILATGGCEREQPTSYLIPKEDRAAPTLTSTDSVKQAPAANTNTHADTNNGPMRVLPGMAEAAAEAGSIRYSVPTGWEELPPSGIRKVNLVVEDEDGRAELTVLVFPGDVGGHLANINRWREQIDLPPVNDEALSSFTQPYAISQHRGLYVRLEGGAQSILGGLLPFHGFTWFFKFQGSSSTVLSNETQMKAFLDSVRLEDTHH